MSQFFFDSGLPLVQINYSLISLVRFNKPKVSKA